MSEKNRLIQNYNAAVVITVPQGRFDKLIGLLAKKTGWISDLIHKWATP